MKSRSLAFWALIGTAGLAALAVLHVWVPPEGGRFVICPFRRFTGIDCPGCGMTRAFAHLAKGEWAAALRDHPLAPLLAAELVALWAVWGGRLAGLWRIAGPRRPELLVLGQMGVFLAVWLERLATGTLP